MFSLICVWINGWVNNREAGDLRRYSAHYDVTLMCTWLRAQRSGWADNFEGPELCDGGFFVTLTNIQLLKLWFSRWNLMQLNAWGWIFESRRECGWNDSIYISIDRLFLINRSIDLERKRGQMGKGMREKARGGGETTQQREKYMVLQKQILESTSYRKSDAIWDV